MKKAFIFTVSSNVTSIHVELPLVTLSQPQADPGERHLIQRRFGTALRVAYPGGVGETGKTHSAGNIGRSGWQ